MIVVLTDDFGNPLLDEFGDALTYDDGTTAPTTPAPAPQVASGSRTYSIDLCQNWARIGECTTGTFTGVIRNLQPGEWRLESAVGAVRFQPGFTLADVDTVRLMFGEASYFAGYVTPIDTGTGGLEVKGGGGAERFTLSGPDAWAALASRITYPTPTTGPPWLNSHDVRVGVASTVAADYITANLGPGAIVERRYPNVTIWDGHVGTSGIWTARLQPLHQLVTRICRDGGITCRVTVGIDGSLFVLLDAPRDLTATLVLSDQGDLLNIQRRRVPASATFVVAGGAGQLIDRLFRTSGSATGADRHEAFVDQSSFAIGNELQQAADTAIAVRSETWSIRAELSDTAAQRLAFLQDYNVGDIIAAEIDNTRYPVPVEAVTFDIGPGRQVVRPVLGVAAPDPLSGLLRDITGLAARFENTIA